MQERNTIISRIYKTSHLGILNMISIIEPSRGDIVSTEHLIWKLIYKK